MNTRQFRTNTWIITPDPGNLAEYFRKLNRVKQSMLAKNILPQTPVFITEVVYEGEDLGRSPAVREIWAEVAADLIVQNKFRLSDESEIARARDEAKRAQDLCTAMEAASRKEGSVRMTQAFAEAVRQLDVSPKSGKSKK